MPTADNGLWRVLPDGRMETTWRIKENARWHDGTPFTADDLVFTTTIDRDADLPILRHPGYASVESVQAALGLICYGLYFILQVRYRRL